MDRVVAEDHLPFAAVSRPLPISVIASLPPLSSCEKVSLRVDKDSGLLVSDNDERLVQSLPLAADFHSCSLFLERTPGRQDTVYLQAARPIKQGESLQLWFSTDIQALIGITFLSPLNIRGDKNYECHFCKKTFEYPNPLKIHLALDCGKLKPFQLWLRLKDAIDLTNNNSGPPIPYDSILRLSLDPVIKIKSESDVNENPPSPAHSSYSSPSPNREKFEETRPSSEPPRNSAFRPYLSLRDEINKMREKYPACPSNRLDKIKHENLNMAVNLNREMYIQQQAAEIETLVSNLGQSKQGHLCLYCGKIYSRKYGLKIHIRTHTGFKPLKCKYCLRPFGDPSNLNKHVRLHSESETPYRCELCGKMLVRRRDLERHMKSRHNLTI